jgi:Tfp pilus assembly protein PilX
MLPYATPTEATTDRIESGGSTLGKEKTFAKTEKDRSERGAALITVLFISLLVLTLASALILTTGMSATNAVSSTDEVQAYYAAEGGMQAALNVLRGNIAPTINFKSAVANPQLAQWLTKNYPSTTPDRVTLSPNYTTANGMAYSITSITDPDLSTKVIYSTSGSFTMNGTTSTSASFAGNVSLNYTPQSSTDITTNASPTLGTFTFTGVKNNTDVTIPAGTTFTLQLTETAPLAVGSTSPISVSIKGTLSGRIYLAAPTVTLTLNNPSLEIPNVGTVFTIPTPLTIAVNASTTTAATLVTTPEPRRLIVKVQGYGPHGAIKNLQAMVSNFAANYDPPATFVIRGHDDSTTASTISIGSSAKFVYSGNDNAGGQPLPAFLVTNNPDFTTLSTLKNNNDLPLDGDSTGLIPTLKPLTLPTDLPQLPSWLQTTSDPAAGARAFVQQLRLAAQQQFYKCTSDQDATCDRYFNTRNGETGPADFGAEVDAPAKGLFTFVDGDATLPNDGGRGLLIVTGTLTVSGSKTFDGLVLVLGDGAINRTGGGSATNFGAFVVARFGSSGGFLNPSFVSSGSGTSGLQLDRNSVKNALRLGGVYVLALSEY